MTNSVLISGASVAGPTLAWYLRRAGHEVTVVERAPALRDSGYAVDFRGAALDVLVELGVLDEVRAHATGARGTVLVDASGAETARWGAEALGGDLEVPKRELTRILHRATADGIEYLFDDSIVGLTSGTVHFERARPRGFDLVIGADGVHSKVRELVFGSGLRHLGLSGAGFSTDDFLGLDRTGVLQPGEGTAVYLFGAGDRLTVSLSFATNSPALDRRPRAEQEHAVRTVFAGHGWVVPRLLDAMSAAPDFYFASSGQVELDRWHRGRVALVGDAGYCAAPTSGMGTSQALIGARTLAKHLAASGDPEAAFRAYEQELRPYVDANQAAGREAAALFGAG
ncbi:FAD-dependent monooxygenase [Cryptosporangium arvum]|uniref:FAD-dependent monooxygenase n=1 Tax=Cryptosporangium arvum TaxID=80871 RepID=UPI0004B1E1A9|nr:FAD-dependent monooxygenase [Cryptosporangium arvum]